MNLVVFFKFLRGEGKSEVVILSSLFDIECKRKVHKNCFKGLKSNQVARKWYIQVMTQCVCVCTLTEKSETSYWIMFVGVKHQACMFQYFVA